MLGGTGFFRGIAAANPEFFDLEGGCALKGKFGYVGFVDRDYSRIPRADTAFPIRVGSSIAVRVRPFPRIRVNADPVLPHCRVVCHTVDCRVMPYRVMLCRIIRCPAVHSAVMYSAAMNCAVTLCPVAAAFGFGCKR